MTVCPGPLEVLVFADELDSTGAGLGAEVFGVDVFLLVEVTLFTGMLGFVLLKDSCTKQNKNQHKLTSFKSISM